MKKLFFTLIFLFFIYFALQAAFYFFGPGHEVNYLVNGYSIKESYTNNKKNEIQNYFFEISKDQNKFYFQIFESFNNESKIITDIKFYNDNNYACILPIFKNEKVLTNLYCINDNVVYLYEYIKGKNPQLDAFYDTVSDLFIKENLSDVDTTSNITLYKNNMLPNHAVSFETYKGYVYATSKRKSLNAKNIFDNDIYDKYLSTYVDNNYVTVDYAEKYGYSNVYIYDILSGKEQKLIFTSNLEKDSYIQGVKDGSLYIFDRSNKKQYEINTRTNVILEVGNVDTGIKMYQHGKWERISAYECINDKVIFSNSQGEENGYFYLASVGGNNSGYTYYYKNEQDMYSIYRVNNQNKDQVTYLFKTKYLDKVIVSHEYVFYLDDAYLKYYSDKTNIRTLVSNSELRYNENLKYQIILEK